MVAANGAWRRFAEEQGATHGVGRGELESKGLVGNRSESGDQGSHRKEPHTFVNTRAKTGVVAQGGKLKDTARNADLAQQSNLREAFVSLETAKMEILERTDSKLDSAVMK